MAGTPGTKAAAAGDVEAGMKSAAKMVEAEYELPYLAHATMEPMNCTVKVAADGCEIWTGTQFQTMDQKSAAEILGSEARAGEDPHDVPGRRVRPPGDSRQRRRVGGGPRG